MLRSSSRRIRRSRSASPASPTSPARWGARSTPARSKAFASNRLLSSAHRSLRARSWLRRERRHDFAGGELMGLTDVLFGRKKLPKAQQEKLFAISTARITLETELGLKPTGDAAVVFKPLSAAEFVRAENELQELLDSVAQESHSKVERRGDEFGFEWLIVRDNDFEELVAGVHLVASELAAHGFGEQLLAAAFKFSGADHPV